MPRLPRPICTAALLLSLSACSGGSTGSSSVAPSSLFTPAAPTSAATVVASPAPSRPPSPAESPAGPTAAGCARTPATTPAGAATQPTLDVDGDGRGDTLWLTQRGSGSQPARIGVTTASGATFSASSDSASPIREQALVVRPTGADGPVDVLLSDSRSLRVLTVTGCGLTILRNEQGEDYVFDINNFYGTGTGLGCVGPGGRRGLTGLLASSTDGRTYTITRTSVLQQGTSLRNGPSDTVSAVKPQDAAEIRSAMAVTCGDRTLQDGVAEPMG